MTTGYGIGDLNERRGCNGFVLLVLLFILLASSCTIGIDKNFFFIIILAIIAFGGFGRTFGFGDTVDL